MMASTDSLRAAARSEPHLPFLTTRISIVILVVAYLPLALTFSFLTRAYEGNDEGAHTEYVEYIVRHDSIPPINIAISAESQEPALYYLVAAGWQHLLGIPAFTPHIVLAKPVGPNRLLLNHDYNSVQRQDAIYLHELRLLSILLGLGTVLLTYASAKVVGLREPMALCAALFVALLPRELAVSSNVTNDACWLFHSAPWRCCYSSSRNAPVLRNVSGTGESILLAWVLRLEPRLPQNSPVSPSQSFCSCLLSYLRSR